MSAWEIDVTAEVPSVFTVEADNEDEATDLAISKAYNETPDAAYVRLNSVEMKEGRDS